MKPKVLLYCPTFKVNGKEQIKIESRKSIANIKFNGIVHKEINSQNNHTPPNYQNVLEHYQRARKKVLSKGYDALFTVEHDIIVPPDGLQKLWDLNVPVAYGIYLFRGSKNVVNAFRMVDAPAPDMSLSIFQDLLEEALIEEVVEVSGCGNGCTLIRREVLEKIDFRQADSGGYCPDMPFATDCLKSGIKQFAHFGVQCGHVLDNKTIWLNTNYLGKNVLEVVILQDFVGKDGIAYKTGQQTVMEDCLIEDYLRAGFLNMKYESHVKDLPQKPKIAIRHHQKKAMPLVKALEDDGFKTIKHTQGLADVLLIDHDIVEYGHGGTVDKFHKAGKPVFIYPHGAAPLLCWDGIHKPNDKIKVNFVTSRGHAEVLRRYGYPVPTEVIGWYLTEVKPWKPVKKKHLNILFAPLHPILGHVFMFEEDKEANAETYTRLLELVKQGKIDLSVRHIGKLDANGLWEADGIEIHQGRTDNTYDDIEKADLVISNGTMAYMSIALGKPTIMLQQMTPSREPDIHTFEKLESKNTHLYEKYMRFPFDVENDDDLWKIIRDACRREPKQWRKRFIGDPFDPVKFCAMIEELVYGDN